MSVSIRESIRWLPDISSEPTTTIVLTSPEHRFVDIRVLKDTNKDSNKDSLDWAFAGVSSSEFRNGLQHSTWRHVVDSRTRTPETVVDQGRIFPLVNGRTLETGRMTNPATGVMTNYEEIWIDLEVNGAEAHEKPENQTQPQCVVLELLDEEREQRGMVVLLGRYCQGVVREGDAFAAERWQLEDGKWEHKHRAGHLWIPGPNHLCRTTLTLGEEIKSEDALQTWRVVEISLL
ncbi:hypothetical protein F4861DRAFT_224142 [Xylaria intraflava]|nr:hypothetical protein F4861DRAFT_224142 [Xylaria intraflava]